ncbi:PRC-barrel domain-containing protein [Caenispirillum salinarum]|uniref:PRC-barrel domain-containing protein n=1 Tax=Caenispirillum salinarum TaxID=859058 RepID=UPI00384CCA65
MKFRAMLMASALAMPLAAAMPGLAAAQDQDQANNGKSYGEKAAENQPEEVEDIRNINTGAMENRLAEQTSVRGDPSFAFPASRMIGRDLVTGKDEEVGEIRDIILGADNTVRAVVVDLDGYDRQVGVPFEQIRLRTGRGPDDVTFTSRMSADELAALEPYRFGDTAAAMTAPQSAAADLPSDVETEQAGALNLTADQQGGDGEMTTQRRDQAEASAMQVPADAPDALERIDMHVTTLGGRMASWYERMSDEWQQADVSDDVRTEVNRQWTNVREAWGDVRRASAENWESARQTFERELQDLENRYQQAVSG